MPLTDKQIREALAVCEAATPGPWEQHEAMPYQGVPVHLRRVFYDEQDRRVTEFIAIFESATAPNKANADLTESARAHYAEALRDLLEAREQLDEAVKVERELLARIAELEAMLNRDVTMGTFVDSIPTEQAPEEAEEDYPSRAPTQHELAEQRAREQGLK